MLDSRDIKELHPVLARAAVELAKRMSKRGYAMLITSTYRDFAYQNYLYAKGRTASGSKVTNAKGGESLHNYRLAFDICKNVKGGEFSDGVFFDTAGKIGVEMGLVWGGHFSSFVDKPHFQWTDGLTLLELQKGKMPVDKKLKWELVKEEDFVIESTKILINEKEYTVRRILKDGRNFVELNSLTQAGFLIGYDATSKTPIVVCPKMTA